MSPISLAIYTAHHFLIVLDFQRVGDPFQLHDVVVDIKTIQPIFDVLTLAYL